MLFGDKGASRTPQAKNPIHEWIAIVSNSPNPANLRALIAPTALILLLLCLSGFSMAFSPKANTHFDFRAQYVAGYMVRTAHASQLYDYEETQLIQNSTVSESQKALPFIHLAYEALLYVPLSFFSYQTAYFVFLSINLALLALAFHLLQPQLLALTEAWKFLPAAIFICFMPVTITLIEGQNSIFLLVLMCLVLVFLQRGEDGSAGFLLGLAVVKFQYVLPIALLFLIWRRWRFLAGLTASGAILFGFSIWLTGLSGFVTYLHLLGNMSTHFSAQNGTRLGIRPELMPNLRGLVFAVSGGTSPISNVITLLASIGVILWAATRRCSFAFALLAASLISYHETFTDATLLIIPVGLAAASVKHLNKSSTYVGLLCASVFIAPALLLLAGERFYLLAVPALLLLFSQAWPKKDQRSLPNRRNLEAVSNLGT